MKSFADKLKQMKSMQSWASEDPVAEKAAEAKDQEEVLKRPSSAPKGALKKPAAAGSTKKRPAAVSPDDEMGAIVEVKKRNRDKDGFFHRRVTELPAEIADQVENMSKADLTRLVNNIVKRDGDGNWCFDIQNPVVSEVTTKTRRSYEKDMFIQQPRGLASTMWGGDDKLEKAIREGEAFERRLEDGRLVIVWAEYKAAKENSNSYKVSVGGSTKALGDAAVKKYRQILGSVDWFPSLTKGEIKAIEDRAEIPEKVLEKLDKAEKAFKKAIAEGQGRFKELMSCSESGVGEVRDTLKKATQTCREQLCVFEDMTKFHTGRDGKAVTYDMVLVELAGATKVLESMLDAISTSSQYKKNK